MRRPAVATSLLLCVLLVGASCSTATHRASSPTTARSGIPTTPTDSASHTWPVSETATQIESDIITHGRTPQRALMLFSVTFGPLPGVPKHTGPVGPIDFDGSRAVIELSAVWDQITPAQRRAVDALLAGTRLAKTASTQAHRKVPTTTTRPFTSATNERQTTTPDSSGPTTSGSTTDLPNPSTPPTTVAFDRSRSTAQVTPAALPTRPSGRQGTTARDLPFTPTWDYDTLAYNADVEESAALGIPTIPTYGISVSYLPSAKTYAVTSLWHTDGTPWDDGCHLIIYDQKFEVLSLAEAQGVIDHELFHCYENRASGTFDRYASVLPWLADGACNWVFAALSPQGSPLLANRWHTYITTPSMPFWSREYDAVGVFAHFGDVVGQQNVWPHLLPAVVAGIDGQNIAAIETLAMGNLTAFFSSWGSSYFEEAGHHNWFTEGPGAVATNGPDPTTFSVGDEDNVWIAPASMGTVSLSRVDASADVVTIIPVAGYGMVHDADNAVDLTLDTTGPISLCLRPEGCTCPEGSVGAATTIVPATGPLTIGLAGGDQDGSAAISGYSLDSYCRKPASSNDQFVPPQSGGGSGGGGGPRSKDAPKPKTRPTGDSVGDPHLTTFDGARYDFQAVGEFTLARSASGDFEVQQRNAAVPNSREIASNKAVALRVGHDVVEWSIDQKGSLERLVDGNPVVTFPTKIGTTTFIGHPTMWGPTDTASFSDGTTVQVTQFSGYGLDVVVTPAADRRGKLVGLLGNDDGKVGNDLDAGGSTAIPSSGSIEQIDHQLADHWRVTEATSLFTYPPGKTTADFTDRKFPYPGTPANIAEAKKACADEGITDPALLHNCIIDFAGTNDTLFTILYGYGQAVDTAKTGHRDAGPATPNRSIHLTGTITKKNFAQQQKKLTLDIMVNAGDVLRITDGDKCQDIGGSLWLFFPPRRNLPDVSAQICGIERVAFPDAGTYHITGRINPGTVGHYDFTIRWIRPDRVENAHYGDTLASTIPGPGEHDVYRFTAHKGDQIKTWGAGCTNPDGMSVGIWDTKNVQIDFNDPCKKAVFTAIPQDGIYEAVVNSSDSASGTYAFVLQK